MNRWASFVSNARIATSMMQMQWRSIWSRRPVSVLDGPVVSLTTYGRRTRLVHLAIESIARGSAKPGRLILWLDEDEYLNNPTPGLRRLMKRGLELKRTPNWGPHKKYFPYVMSVESHSNSLVTADDDTLYPSTWLQALVDGHRDAPNAIVACRAHRIEFEGDAIAPYAAWTHAAARTISARNFGVGVGGILYPPRFLDAVRNRGDGFTEVAPFADDVWLHATAVRDGRAIAFVNTVREADFLPVRGSRTRGLFSTNIDSGGNDRQIAAAYSASEIDTLLASTTERF